MNVQNKIGDTPLHLAAYRGHGETITLLLQHGALSSYYSSQASRFLIAFIEHSIFWFSLIGADKSLANSDGKLAYQLATDPAAAALLRDRRASALMQQSYIAEPDEDGAVDDD